MGTITSGVLLAADPGHAWGPGGPWGIFGGLLMVLFWVLVIFGVLMLLRRGTWTHERGRNQTSGIERAREILAERYARGEISTEEYWERRDQLLL